MSIITMRLQYTSMSKRINSAKNLIMWSMNYKETSYVKYNFDFQALLSLLNFVGEFFNIDIARQLLGSWFVHYINFTVMYSSISNEAYTHVI